MHSFRASLTALWRSAPSNHAAASAAKVIPPSLWPLLNHAQGLVGMRMGNLIDDVRHATPQLAWLWFGA